MMPESWFEVALWGAGVLAYLVVWVAASVFFRYSDPRGNPGIDGFLGFIWPIVFPIVFVGVLCLQIGKLAKKVVGK